MPDNPLARKLLIKPGMSVRLLNEPTGFATQLEPLPAGSNLTSADDADFILLFADSKAELDENLQTALTALKPGSVFWVAFPKGSSKVQTDLTRDRGWDTLHAAGWQLVSLVSLDNKWSAGRIRPSAGR